MRPRQSGWIAILLVLPPAVAHGQWRPVAPGITYQAFRLDGPVDVCVARADRAATNWTIDTSIGRGMLRTGRETVSELARRYDGTVDLRGRRHEVKVAINGDYFSFQTDQPATGQIISGWFAKRFGDYSGGSGFVWTWDRRCFLGGNVRNGKSHQRVKLADGTELPLTQLNGPRGENELVLYTPQYADQTYTSNDGVEVIVAVAEPVGVATDSRGTTGEIVQVRDGVGSASLPFDQVVLSGHGSAAQQLREHAKVGQRVEIRLGVQDYGVEEIDLPPRPWDRPYASIGGHFYCVVRGKVPAERWEKKGKPGAILRHPRTAVAMNDNYVYFIVADGRSERSVGMTITELGEFCLRQLSATYAIAQDGGGSSTLWVDGRVMNVPSDGRERPVANGYLMAIVHEPELSRALAVGDGVRPRRETEVRLGPGTEYGIAGCTPAEQGGIILAHRLNGVRAKQTHWWKCAFGDLVGWVSRDDIEPDAEPR